MATAEQVILQECPIQAHPSRGSVAKMMRGAQPQVRRDACIDRRYGEPGAAWDLNCLI